MTTTDAVPIPAEPGDPVARESIPWIYVLAVFCGAAMVFMVQPMVAKLVLPQLGGSPQVWNTSMAFFQAALLVGYGYAHFLQKIPRARTQVLVHLVVMLAAATLLPLRITDLLGEPSNSQPALWLVGVLAVSIGAPFAALSATAPLVQAWHAKVHGRTGGPEPWALYAASNLGSLLALLAYPAMIEPGLILRDQRWGWSGLYATFVVIMAVLAVNIRRHDTGPAPQAAAPGSAAAAPVTWRQRLTWIALAALPSSLMLGVTAHLTTDVASAPFLWVAPLSLYLLTFIIAFQNRPMIPPRLALVLMSTALIVTVATLPFGSPNVLATLAIHLATFFLCALVCHQALVARRPDPARLTDFYLCMSIGGVVGGAFNAFVAPLIFETVVEYIVVLCLCALVRPAGPPGSMGRQFSALAATLAPWMPAQAPPRSEPADPPEPSGSIRRELIVLTVAVAGSVLAMRSVTSGFWTFLGAHRFSAATLLYVLVVLGLMATVALAVLAWRRPEEGEGAPRRLEWRILGAAGLLWLLALVAATVPAVRVIHGVSLIDLVLILVLISGVTAIAAFFAFRLRPAWAIQPSRSEWLGLVLAVLGFDIALLAFGNQFGTAFIDIGDMVRVVAASGVVIIAVAAVMLRERSLFFFAAIVLLAYTAYAVDPRADYYESRRSFFGVVHFTYADIKELGGKVRVFSHGTTLHGAQAQAAAFQCRPLVYYAPETPIGQVFTQEQAAKPAVDIAAIGLGTGAVSAYVRPADRMTFFEIDPQVVAVSSDPKVFSYTTKCAKGPVSYILGDARLTLEKQPNDSYDILLVDAFSSDAIPAHLLTVEAVRGYLARIKPDGVVILHLSNRHLELVFPAASVVKAAGGYALFQGHQSPEGSPAYWESSEDVMIVGRNREALAKYAADPRWLLAPPPTVRPWTDDYTNLVGAMIGNIGKRRWTWQQEAETVKIER